MLDGNSSKGVSKLISAYIRKDPRADFSSVFEDRNSMPVAHSIEEHPASFS